MTTFLLTCLSTLFRLHTLYASCRNTGNTWSVANISRTKPHFNKYPKGAYDSVNTLCSLHNSAFHSVSEALKSVIKSQSNNSNVCQFISWHTSTEPQLTSVHWYNFHLQTNIRTITNTLSLSLRDIWKQHIILPWLSCMSYREEKHSFAEKAWHCLVRIGWCSVLVQHQEPTHNENNQPSE